MLHNTSYRVFPMTSQYSAGKAYSPRVFDGDVVYVAARGSAPPTGWERCIGGHISVREIDAVHEDMLGSAGARALGRVIGTHVREGVAS